MPFVHAQYEAALPHAVDEDWLLSIQLLSTLMNDGLKILICLEGILLPKSIQDPVAEKIITSISKTIQRTLLRRGMTMPHRLKKEGGQA